MNRTSALLPLLAALSLPMSFQAVAEQAAASQPAAATEAEISYFLGYSYGVNLLRSDISSVDMTSVQKGINDALKQAEPSLAEDRQKAVINEMNRRAQALQAKRQAQAMEQQKAMDAQRDENIKKGDAYLASNKAKEGVRVTESGLQIKTLTPGEGKKPTAENKVKVHYEGKLIDGTVFDSSYKRGEPAEFGLQMVISGWTEGLQLMQEGEVAELVIPYDLAYGTEGNGRIPGASVLVFKVELIEILE